MLSDREIRMFFKLSEEEREKEMASFSEVEKNQIKRAEQLTTPIQENWQPQKIGELPNGWRSLDVDKKVGNKRYTEGQKNYMRAMMIIEGKLGKAAADMAKLYGSEDIEMLADEYYSTDLKELTLEQLKGIEEKFNETHGYHIILQKAKNPFKGIDFLGM